METEMITGAQISEFAAQKKTPETKSCGRIIPQDIKKYIDSITVDYKSKFLGYFSDPIEAALKYDQAAILLFGEYARPNFMEERMHEEVLELEQKRRHGAA